MLLQNYTFFVWISDNCILFLIVGTCDAKAAAVNLNLVDVQNHVSTLIVICKRHRDNADQYFDENIYSEVVQLSELLEVDLVLPRHRSSGQAQNMHDHYRQVLYIPYLDSLITSLNTRFSDDHSAAFKLSCLIPSHLGKLSRSEYSDAVSEISKMYSVENFAVEAMTWYDHWLAQSQKPANICDALNETDFYPAMKDALIILATLPATTCSVERSFSTLRRVKTWLRSMGMSDFPDFAWLVFIRKRL